MRRTTAISFFLILLLFSGSLFGQDRTSKGDIYSDKELCFYKAVYIVLTGAGLLPDSISPEEAVGQLRRLNWEIELRSDNETISLGELSNLIMYAFQIEGGLLYTMYPTPEYAARELGERGFVPINADIYRKMSGKECMDLVEKVRLWKAKKR